MVVENINFTTDSINLTNKSVRTADLSTINNSEYRVVSGYFRWYPQTGGIEDGRASDFVNRNIIKEQGTEVLPQ
jgi:hypothetical protein